MLALVTREGGENCRLQCTVGLTASHHQEQSTYETSLFKTTSALARWHCSWRERGSFRRAAPRWHRPRPTSSASRSRRPVIDVVAKPGLFESVQLGDPVRGVLTYDLNVAPAWTDVFNTAGYEWISPTFDGIEMSVDNPRTGETIEFTVDMGPQGFYQVIRYNDWAAGGGAFFDSAWATQYVEPLRASSAPTPRLSSTWTRPRQSPTSPCPPSGT